MEGPEMGPLTGRDQDCSVAADWACLHHRQRIREDIHEFAL